jgi:hypothetical protein
MEFLVVSFLSIALSFSFYQSRMSYYASRSRNLYKHCVVLLLIFLGLWFSASYYNIYIYIYTVKPS